MITVHEAVDAFLANIKKSRAPMTHRAYYNAMQGKNGFERLLKSPKTGDPIEKLNEKHAMAYMQDILHLSPATRQLHAAALRRFYTFIAGNDWATVSLDRLNFLFEGANVLSPANREIVYDKAKVRNFLDWVYAWAPNGNTPIRHLRNMRDQAFTITLAESGLRVHEACKLKIKDIDFEKASGIIVGKGKKQARFKIGAKAIELIRAYLQERDGFVPVAQDQPVFARHDHKSGKQRTLPMTPQTGEAIIHQLEALATGERTLTCHTLRHRFVTRVLERSGNLKSAQELARHTNIAVTERYAHLIDEEIDSDFNKAINE